MEEGGRGARRTEQTFQIQIGSKKKLIMKFVKRHLNPSMES
jgi:hypothetical protein